MPENFNLIDILSNQTARNAREYSRQYDDYSGLPSVSRQVDLVEREKNLSPFRPTSMGERTRIQANNSFNTIPVETIDRNENLKTSDRDAVWTSVADQLNLEDRRARQQSGAERLANGVMKGVVIAGTTFLDGVVGTAAGIVNLAFQAANGDIERPADALYAFIDNPVSRNLQKINDWAEKVMPNYYSNEQRESPWYNPVNLFSANFVGDKFVKNLGFMLGAAYSGKVNANVAAKTFAKKELRDAFKGIVVTSAKTGKELTTASEIYKAFKTGDALADGIKMTEHLGKQAKQMLRQEWGLKLLGAATSAAGEARIEAITNTEDYTKRMQQMLDDERDRTISQIQDQVIALNSEGNKTYDIVEDRETGRSYPVLTPLGQQIANQMMSEAELTYQRACNQLQQDRALMANQIFGLNMFVLTSSNLYTFGRFMAGGYNTGSRASDLLKGSIKEGYERSLIKGPVKKAMKAVSVPIAEGPYEEMMQASIARGTGYHASAKMNQFYGYTLDEEAQEDAVNSVNAILQGIRDTYSDINNWEEGLIGGLSSIVGIPGFVETRNDDGITQYEEYQDENGETRYKPKKNFRMQGEFWDSIRDVKAANRKGKQLAEELNKIVKQPEFVERWQSYIRHKDLDRLMKERMDNGDIFGYKNLESDQIISDILAFDKAGRMEDLMDMIEESMNLTEADGKVIKEQSTDKSGISPYGKMTDQAVADAVMKHAGEFKKILENYIKVKDDIRQVYGTEMDDKYLDSLTWGYMSIQNAEERIKELSGKLVPKLNDVFHIYSTISGQDLNLKVDNLADLFRFSLNDADKKKFITAMRNNGSIENLSTEKTLSRIGEILGIKDQVLDELEAAKDFGTKEEIAQKTALHETILNQYLKALNLLNLIDADPSLHPISDMEMKTIRKDLLDIGNLILYRSDFLDMLAVLTNNPGAFEKSIVNLNAMMIDKNNEKMAQQVYDSITPDMNQKAFNDLLLNSFKNRKQLDILEGKLEKSTDENIKRLYQGYTDFIDAYSMLFDSVQISENDPLAGLKSVLLNNLDNRINEEAASNKDELIQYLREEAQKLGFQEAVDYAEELINKINVSKERKDKGDDMIKPKEPAQKPTEEDKKEEKKKKKAEKKKKKEVKSEEETEKPPMFDNDGGYNPEYDRPTGLAEEQQTHIDDNTGEDLLNAEETIKNLPIQDLVAIVEDNLIPESLLGKIEISKIVDLAKFYLEEADDSNISESEFNDVIDYKDRDEDNSASPEKVVRGQKVFEYPDGTLLNGLGVTKYDINELNEHNNLKRYNSELGDILDSEFNAYGFIDSGALAAIEKNKIEKGDRTKVYFIFANKNEGARYEGRLHTIQNEGQDNQRDNYNILLAVELTEDAINSLNDDQKKQMKPVIIGKSKYQIVGSLAPTKGSQESRNAYNTVYARCIDSIDRQRESSATSEQDLFIGDSNGKELFTTIAKIYTGRLQKIIPGQKYKPIKELLDDRYQHDIHYGVAVKSKKYGTIKLFTGDDNKPNKNPEEVGIPAIPGMVYAFIPAPDGSTSYVPIVMARSDDEDIDWYADNSFVNPIRQSVATLLDSSASDDAKFKAKRDIMKNFGQPFQLYYRLEDPTSFKFAGKTIKSWDDFVDVLRSPSSSLRVQFYRYAPQNPKTISILVDNGLMLTRYQSLQHYNSSFLVWGLDYKTGEGKTVQQSNISEIRNNPIKDTIEYVVQYGNKQYHLNDDAQFVDENEVVVDNSLAKRLFVQLSVAHTDDQEDFGLNIKRESGKTMMLYTIEGASDGSFNKFYMARNVKSKVVKEISESDANTLHNMIERENAVQEARDTLKEAAEKGFDISHNIQDRRVPANPEKLTDKDFAHTAPQQEEKKEEEQPQEKKKRRRKQTYVTSSVDIDAIGGEDPTDEDRELVPFIRKYGRTQIFEALLARGYTPRFEFEEVSDIIIAQELNRIFNNGELNSLTQDDLENVLKCGNYGGK